FSETSALFHISISRGGTCTSTLAKLLHVSPPTVTQIIAKFAELGLVTRTTDSADRRMVRVKLTPSGAAVVHEIHEDTVTRFRGLASELGENDTRTLVDLLSRVSGYFSDKKEETQCLK
ncbi:MAG: MarR family transcriptional regulator, partial [Clostridia bacterium]